ncbi:MAG: hypothetical protein IJG97_04470 [Bacilli bacterium]|nr:hypothetical protein [Bacilli bacterium]
MSEEAQRIYRDAFYIFLKQYFDSEAIDSIVDNANLYFGPSNDITYNINSKYFSVLNSFYFSSLTDEELIALENKKSIDNEVLDIVARTYKNSLRKDGVSGVMYDPPAPDHYVENGSLVLEFVYGKNTKKVSDEEYITLYKNQKAFIEAMTDSIKNVFFDKLGINCEIFVSKRVRRDG